MSDSRKNDGSGPFFAVLLLLVLLVAGGAVFMWFRLTGARLQKVIAAREQAVAKATLAEAAQQAPSKDSNRQSLETAIQQVLQTQQRAWNDGDIDEFMESCWKSEDLTFSSGGKVTRGWQATRDNYKKKYPTRDEMGQLAFDNLEITPLGNEAALVLGEWQLTREPQADLGGKFSLVFRLLDGKWLIIHDHTSKIPL